ncbi:ABC transporter permease [Natronosalvus caseinilyticus]|uniref:ABC transporter permease n=1 Tax=Natronosalvus caseinilyticus TaxID=2953747 RepID=UPI003CCD3D8F
MSERVRTTAADVLYPVGALAVGTALWWTTVAVLEVPPFLLPPPDAVAARLVANPHLYLRNAWLTLEKVAYGGGLGALAGFVLAILIDSLPWFRRSVYPYLVTVRVVPKIAIAPLLLIYLGTGMGTAVVFVALIAFFPLVLNTIAGLGRTPEEQLDLMRSVNAHPVETFVRVRLPYALPDVFAGLKQSTTLAVVGAVIAEWLVADGGLGFLILLAAENVRTDTMLAALLVLLVEGLVLYGGVVALQRGVDRYAAA